MTLTCNVIAMILTCIAGLVVDLMSVVVLRDDDIGIIAVDIVEETWQAIVLSMKQ